MRSVLSVCFLLLAVSPLGAWEQWGSSGRPLTVVVDAGRPIPAPVMREMRYEMDRLLGAAGILVDFRLRNEISLGVNLDDLVLANFKGQCRIGAASAGEPSPEENRALAYTHVTDGRILPFAVVLCDKVSVAVRQAMWGSDFNRGDQILGRALARVLAHEIFHIIGKEHEHSTGGVFKHSLSGRDLIAESLDFHPREIRRLREYGRAEPSAGGAGERISARD